MTHAPHRGRTRSTIRGVVLGCLAAVALVASACGSDDEPTSAQSDERPSTTVAESSTTTEPQSLEEFDLEETVWFGSFQVEISNARTETDDVTGSEMLRFDLSLDNLSESSQGFRANETLLWLGEDESIGSADWDGDNVDGGGRGKGTLSFDLSDFEGTVDLDELELRVGEETANQVLLPLNGDDPTTLEPVELQLSEEVVAGVDTFDVTGGTVQYNDVLRNASLDEGTALLTVELDMSLSTGDYSGSRSVRLNDWRIELPSGATMSIEDSEGFESMAPGTDLKGLSVTFQIETPVAGDYVIQMVGADEANDTVTTPFEFTIEEPDAEGG